MNIPIVIAAYNREHTLSRLLSSLAKAHYPFPVKLIISIDGGGSDEVRSTAASFVWEHGEKEVIEHAENLGLRQHILKCGRITKDYDGIVLLEDDLYVSPWFYHYTLAALDSYKDTEVICGVSLYSYRFNETSLLPFVPLDDDSHVFFMQLPCSWGQAWLKEHWQQFDDWYIDHCNLDYSDDLSLPVNITKWPESSWKKYFAKYMVETNKFFVYPVNSYTTNFGDRGTHHQGSRVYQVPLMMTNIDHYFKPFKDSFLKYDACCELMPECLNNLCGNRFDIKFSVDLHGTKTRESLSGEFVFTSKSCHSYLKSFGRNLLPIELNVACDVPGNDIFLANVDEIKGYGNIHNYILERATNIQYQQYYFGTDTYHYSLLHRAERRINELYQEGQLLEASLRESSRLIGEIYDSLSWRVTAPFRKSLALLKKFHPHKDNERS
ncbi:glycosyltransferase family A protein [Geobacter sp. DSM 9736]|uniref:glycosyltransferase family 2 protein n=1 Tax=Geobacter sp. DSM 9736 TaxID=1277350 RepID=UPI000B50F31E|nr:glycosyltransferase family A protein [Geobacter sp. DSM 9736]SNB46621.1 Glycosyl transferase family 2 [Geobacter sp. DSM 9736]